MKKSLMVVVVACVVGLLAAEARAKPLKVYILAGQSNMQGHAKVETFDYIGDDATTAASRVSAKGPGSRISPGHAAATARDSES